MSTNVCLSRSLQLLYFIYTHGLFSEINSLLSILSTSIHYNVSMPHILLPGMEEAIREVCDELLGPVCRSKSTQQWDNTVLVGDIVIVSCLSNRHFSLTFTCVTLV